MENAYQNWQRDSITHSSARKESSDALDKICFSAHCFGRHAVRATMLFSSMLCLRDEYLGAGMVLRRATQVDIDKDRLTAALLHEQSAICSMLQPGHAHFRRFCFRLIQAGHGFMLWGSAAKEAKIKPRLPPEVSPPGPAQGRVGPVCDTPKAAATHHSLRSYVSSYPVFDRRGWELVSDHIHARLSRHCFAISTWNEAAQQRTGDSTWEEAMRHSAALLRTADSFTLPLRGAEPPGWVDAFQTGSNASASSDANDSMDPEEARSNPEFLNAARYLVSAPSLVSHHDRNGSSSRRSRSMKGHWQSVERQAQYLREFLHVFDAATRNVASGSEETLPVMPIPIVHSDTIEVDLRDSPHTAHTPAGVAHSWKEMENDILAMFGPDGLGDPSEYQSRADELRRAAFAPTWLELANSTKSPKGADPVRGFLPPHLQNLQGVVGEVVKFSLELENPLDIPVQLDDVRLLCESLDRDGKPLNGESSASAQTNGGADPLGAGQATGSDSANSSVVSSTTYDAPAMVFILKPRERRRVELAVVPMTENAMLHVFGISFNLQGSVAGRVDLFNAQGAGQRRSHNDGVLVEVSPQQPLLEAYFEDLPQFLLNGQSDSEGCLVLKNCGSTPLDGVRARLGDDSASMFQFSPSGVERTVPVHGTIVELHQAALAPGASVRIPVAVRPSTVGSHQFSILIQYLNSGHAASGEGCILPFRLLRVVGSMVCVPSLQVTAATSVSYSTMNAYVLQVDVANMHSASPGKEGQSFELCSLQRFSDANRWQLQPLSGVTVDGGGSPVVGPSQSRSMFFRLVPEGDNPTAEAADPLMRNSADGENADQMSFFLKSDKV
jgi:hypothetical protein